MIVSHRYRFIFMHGRKVAGSSLKVSLAPYLGDDDVVIGSWNEILESGVSLNKNGVRALRHPKARLFYWAARLKGKSAEEAVNVGIKAYYRNRLSVNPPHPTAKEAKNFFPSEWEDYYKFSFVRNPYERLVSDYYWRKRMKNKEFSFREYLELLESGEEEGGALHPGGASNWDMLSVDNKVEMDFVGRYETLNKDFNAVCSKLEIPASRVASKQKVRPGGRDYGSLYGPEEKEIVRRVCDLEIEAFGYDFPY